MEFIKEDKAFRHYNESGNMDAEITYTGSPESEIIIADHTYVSETLRGQGIAGQLLDKLVKFAEEEGLKIKALCPYVVRKFEDSKFDFINADK